MAWFALAMLASVVPAVRWWVIARRRSMFGASVEMVLPVAGTGPTDLIALEIARVLHLPEAPVAAITRRDGLRISVDGAELARFGDHEPTTMTELVAIAAEFAAIHAPSVRKLVIDVGVVEPGTGPVTAAYTRGARLAVVAGLPDRTADQQRFLAALCPRQGVLVTSESDPDRLETIAVAAANCAAVVVSVETQGRADLVAGLGAETALVRAVASSVAITLGLKPTTTSAETVPQVSVVASVVARA